MPRIKIWTYYPKREEVNNKIFIHKDGPQKYTIYHRFENFKGFTTQASTNKARIAKCIAEAIAKLLNCEVSREG